MKMQRKLNHAGRAGLALLLGLALDGFGAFSSGPSVSELPDSVVVTFAVPTPTDVEVAVLDGTGKVIRHLAAGVLGGEFAPPEPLQSGLSQRMAWDKKDDQGNPVFGNHKIRVRQGVRPALHHDFSIAAEMRANNKHMVAFPFIVKRPDGTDSVVAAWRYNRILDTARFLNPQTSYIELAHPLFHYAGNPTIPMYEDRNNFDLEVADASDEVLIHGYNRYSAGAYANTLILRFNGLTGAYTGKTSFTSGQFSLGTMIGGPGWSEPVLSWDGQYCYYADNYNNAAFRFTAAGASAPWSGTGKNYVRWDTVAYGGDIHNLGHAPGPDGSHYFLSYRKVITTYYSAYKVTRVRDGIAETIIDSIECAPSGGIQVDAKGNIYLAAVLRPNGKYLPDFIPADSLDNVLIPPYIGPADTPNATKAAKARLLTQRKIAHELIGSIIKFSPSGGTLKKTAGTSAPYTCGTPAGDWYIQGTGVDWIHYGVSHVETHSSAGVGACVCNQIRFDVDRFGRIYYPNTFMHEFCAIDNNRNPIYRIHNRDVPGLKLSMAHQIRHTDNGLYVTDMYRSRIVAFNWVADDEKEFAVNLAVEAMPSLFKGASLSLSPNPANPSTRVSVSYGLEKIRGFRCRVYDAAGRQVADLTERMTRGQGTLVWNAAGLPSGVYTLRASTPDHALTRSLAVMR